jgi:hypothetical protein
MKGGYNQPPMPGYPQFDPRFENGPDSGMRLQESVRQPTAQSKKAKKPKNKM